jgi:hypothetical protein
MFHIFFMWLFIIFILLAGTFVAALVIPFGGQPKRPAAEPTRSYESLRAVEPEPVRVVQHHRSRQDEELDEVINIVAGELREQEYQRRRKIALDRLAALQAGVKP